jgi:sulfite exporter TauE/SafE
MMLDVSLMSVFLLGLLGGVHCAGMCGGIVAAIGGLGAPGTDAPSDTRARAPFPVPVVAARARTPWATLLRFNAGRLTSYTLAGAIAGGAGSLAWVAARMLPVQQFAFVATNLVLIAVGAYVLGAARWVHAVETAGQGTLGRLWNRLRPLAARSLASPDPARAYVTGLVWGWVPCGMVYAALLSALVSGGPLAGAATMLAFGAGTLPNLLGLGWAAHRAGAGLRAPWVKTAAGIAIIAFGLAGLARLDPLAHLQELAALCLTPFQSPAR